jgi:peroxiredoxin
MLWTLLFFVWQAQAAPKQVGSHAANFALPAINTQTAVKLVGSVEIMLSRFVGPVPQQDTSAVVLYFFSKNAGAKELNDLNELHKKYRKKQGVRILGICSENRDVSSWIINKRLQFPVLHDKFMIVADRYQIDNFPTTILIDRKGRIFAQSKKNSGEISQEIALSLDSLLKEDRKIYRGK